jgi:DNA-directed RNA polymerase alpha subunit
MQFLTKEQFLALKGVEEYPDEQKELLDKKIDDSYLSIRIKNICKANGLNTVRDICRLAKTDWMKFRHGGHKSMREIDDYLKDNGLDWGMNV